jgi:hypothetical protein
VSGVLYFERCVARAVAKCEEVEMKTSLYIFFAAGLVGLASPLSADSAGKYEDPLIQAMMAEAVGKCPASLMADVIKEACDQQMPDLKSVFARLGTLKKVSYQGTKSLRSGPAENYKVNFDHGDWFWMIQIQTDGKISVLWAPEGPIWDMGSSTVPGSTASPRN